MVRTRKDRRGASHAVYFAELVDGLQCVLRVVMHATEDIGLDVWMAERCRERGVPAPEVLTYDAVARDGWPAYAIMRRLPGVHAYGVRLPAGDRREVLCRMGTYLAAIHTIPVAGFGQLVRTGETYAGRESSLWTHVEHEVSDALARLRDDVLPPARRERIYRRFVTARSLLDRPTAVICHGDYRLANTLLLRESGRWRVSGVLDFEMAHAGDPAYDLASFFYSLRLKPWREADLAAICDGYGISYPLPPELLERVLLYQVHAAVGQLFWEISWEDQEEIDRVLGWLDQFEAALDDLAARYH